MEHEESVQDQLKRFTQREIEDGEAREIENQLGRFEGLKDPALEEAVVLPGGSHFAWVYTPQYGEPVEAADEPAEEAEEQQIVYSHIFPNGVAELTLVCIESLEDEDDGFTLEVEPLSGKVHLHDEELDWEDLLDWLPEEGPELDL